MIRRSSWIWFVAVLAPSVAAVCLIDHYSSWSAHAAPPKAAAKPELKAAGKETADSKEAKRKHDEEDYELYRALADTIDQAERNYVKPVDRRELMEAAIKGVIGKLDPYSSYISPDELGGFKTAVESQFGGIGIQVSADEGVLRVISPMVGTPAYRAGVQSGDRIVKIAGDSTSGMNIDDAVHKLKGELGTSVSMSIIHVGSTKPEEVTLTREIIHVDTVMGDTRKEDDSWNFMFDADKKIGFIRVTGFSRDTAMELRKALKELKAAKVKGLVIDLRFNPGGLLTSAIEICDMFIDDGRIVSTKGRNTPERVWDATKSAEKFDDFPIAVLVNHYSASASEITSACLQDHKRAIVIGERSWGKGSVQNVIDLEEGKAALKLTTASYWRPSGHNIHRFPDSKETDEWGVKPNDGYEVKLNDQETNKLIQYRRMRDILVAHHVEDKPPVEGDKPAEGKTDADKANEVKTDADKPKEEKDPAVKPDGDKPEADKPDVKEPTKDDKTSKSGEKISKPTVEATKKPEFIDRQLQKALDYLNSEMAKAK